MARARTTPTLCRKLWSSISFKTDTPILLNTTASSFIASTFSWKLLRNPPKAFLALGSYFFALYIYATTHNIEFTGENWRTVRWTRTYSHSRPASSVVSFLRAPVWPEDQHQKENRKQLGAAMLWPMSSLAQHIKVSTNKIEAIFFDSEFRNADVVYNSRWAPKFSVWLWFLHWLDSKVHRSSCTSNTRK